MTETACAHRRILYAQINHPNGTCSDRWECDNCGRHFGPIPLPPEPKRKVTKTVEAWMNVMWGGGKELYFTVSDADRYVPYTDRIACVHLTGTYEVEE